MNINDIEIDGIVRNLQHLENFTVVLAGKGKEGADLRIGVSLGLHTVSRACKEGEAHNMYDEDLKPRVFCEDRYVFSIGLKEIASRMIREKYYCWISEDRNRAMNYAILDVAPGRILQLPKGEHQTIFFYLYPNPGPDIDVNFHIVSCHMRYVDIKRIQRRFDTHVLLKKCLYENKRLP